MAQRTCFLLLLGVMVMAGCQEQPVVDRLPSPNFNGPIVQAPPAQPAPQVLTAPRPQVQPRPAAPQTAAVPREWLPAAAPNAWRWIVIHHSATPAGGAKAFDRMHKQKGWDELGYHFVIGNGTDTGDGQIEVGPRWGKQKWGAHAKTPSNEFNNYGIGICLVGNFDTERPTRAQMQSLAKLVAYLMRTYHVGADHVLGHGDTKATECPGRHMNVAEVKRLAGQILAASGAAPDTRSARQAAAREMLTDVGSR